MADATAPASVADRIHETVARLPAGRIGHPRLGFVTIITGQPSPVTCSSRSPSYTVYAGSDEEREETPGFLCFGQGSPSEVGKALDPPHLLPRPFQLTPHHDRCHLFEDASGSSPRATPRRRAAAEGTYAGEVDPTATTTKIRPRLTRMTSRRPFRSSPGAPRGPVNVPERFRSRQGTAPQTCALRRFDVARGAATVADGVPVTFPGTDQPRRRRREPGAWSPPAAGLCRHPDPAATGLLVLGIGAPYSLPSPTWWERTRPNESIHPPGDETTTEDAEVVSSLVAAGSTTRSKAAACRRRWRV